MFENLKKFIDSPIKLFPYILRRNRVFRLIPDKKYLQMIYRLTMGRNLNLENPISFNEKLQWLKLYDRKKEYIKLADKYEVRKIIDYKIGKEYLVPLIGVFDSFEEIDFKSLPDKFALKPNHTSGDVFICQDKSKINHKQLKKQVNKWLKSNYYWTNREWPYKNMGPRIICEKFMVDETGSELKDYKVFCFNGEPKLIQVDYNRFQGHKKNIYDINWNYVDASIQYPSDPKTKIEKPRRFDDMLKIAKILAENYPFVRVDFYSIDNNIYFGEMTFYPGAGFLKFDPETLGQTLGDWIELPIRERR